MIIDAMVMLQLISRPSAVCSLSRHDADRLFLLAFHALLSMYGLTEKNREADLTAVTFYNQLKQKQHQQKRN